MYLFIGQRVFLLLLLFFNSEFWREKCVNNQTATFTAPYENRKFNMTHTSFLNEVDFKVYSRKHIIILSQAQKAMLAFHSCPLSESSTVLEIFPV